MFKIKNAPPTVEIKLKTCRVCNKSIAWHRKVYTDDVCWDCFKRTVIAIAKEVKTLEDTEIILHLLGIAERYYNGPDILTIPQKPNDYYWNIIKSSDEYMGHTKLNIQPEEPRDYCTAEPMKYTQFPNYYDHYRRRHK